MTARGAAWRARCSGAARRWRTAGWALAVTLPAALATPCAAQALPSLVGLPSLPTFVEVKAAHQPSDLTLLDRHGVPVQTLRVDKSVRRLPWVALDDTSPALLQAIEIGRAHV